MVLARNVKIILEHKEMERSVEKIHVLIDIIYRQMENVRSAGHISMFHRMEKNVLLTNAW